MNEHFNQLTPAEDERLALLMEECGEVIQIIGKIMRHGYENTHPDGGPTNRKLLEIELGHVMQAVEMLTNARDLNVYLINEARREKHSGISKFLHHYPKYNPAVVPGEGNA